MKLPLRWLARHLHTNASAATIAETLTRIGHEVESVTDRGAALAAFRVAHVVAAIPHPNADRLRLCTVETGEGTVEVVCGAPNARAGMRAVFAPPGSRIPATGAILKIGEIRGIRSHGMLLSLREMGLGTEHDGIVELGPDAPVGTAYAAYAGLADPVLDIALTPNRGDCLSARGLARELAAAGLGRLLPSAPATIAGHGPSVISWHNEFPQACPFILGRTVRGVRNTESPPWLRTLLEAAGLRPINALVDLTNFFTLDLGRPLHVFDCAKLDGDLTLRPGRDEDLAALDGRTYRATAADCVIADRRGIVSLAGIMGGAASGCDEATRDVFLECALFDPIRIAETGRRLHLTSDARQRFERGVDPAILREALDQATALLVELCGGTPSRITEVGAEPATTRTASLDFARLDRLAGATIPPAEALAHLDALGFTRLASPPGTVRVTVPSWRHDIAAPTVLDPASSLAPDRVAALADACAIAEPAADLAEEILRLRGLDSIAPVSLATQAILPAPAFTPAQTRDARARRLLASRGMTECVTFSFTDAATASWFGATRPIRLANPIAADLDTLRPTTLATLARAGARNAAHGWPDQALFEIGPGFQGTDPAGQLREAAGLRTGSTPRDWRQPARALDAFDAKEDLLALIATLGLPMDAVSVSADAPAFFHPGQSGTLRQGPKRVLGWFGALHPSLLAAFDLPHAVGFVLDLGAIPDPKSRRRAVTPSSPLHPVRRDFAFVCDPALQAATLLRAIGGAEHSLLHSVRLFDRFTLPDGKISLGVEILLQPDQETLTQPAIEAISARIVAAAAKLGAVLR